MKKTPVSKPRKAIAEDMRPEYQLDYGKAKPNRFAGRSKEKRVLVLLDPDVAQVFTTSESVNETLRALIALVPRRKKRKNGTR